MSCFSRRLFRRLFLAVWCPHEIYLHHHPSGRAPSKEWDELALDYEERCVWLLGDHRSDGVLRTSIHDAIAARPSSGFGSVVFGKTIEKLLRLPFCNKRLTAATLLPLLCNVPDCEHVEVSRKRSGDRVSPPPGAPRPPPRTRPRLSVPCHPCPPCVLISRTPTCSTRRPSSFSTHLQIACGRPGRGHGVPRPPPWNVVRRALGARARGHPV